MQLLAALLIADNVRQRAEQGDCPTIPAQPIETLENVVMELQRALARDAVAGAIVEIKAERDRALAALAKRDGDAVRYGWLRSNSDPGPNVVRCVTLDQATEPVESRLCFGDDLDAKIDAEIIAATAK